MRPAQKAPENGEANRIAAAMAAASMRPAQKAPENLPVALRNAPKSHASMRPAQKAPENYSDFRARAAEGVLQ